VALRLSVENALRWLVSYVGIHRAGGVAVPLNPRLAPAEVERMLVHAEATAVIGEGGNAAAALVVDASLTSVEDATAAEPARARAVPPPSAAARVVSWDQLLSDDDKPIQVDRAEDDLADILYTSGTTGRPKGVAVRHVNASMMPPTKPSWNGGAWLHASPMFTFAGLSFVYNPMKLGLSAIYMPRFDAGRWLEAVEQARPVAVFLVPAMTQLLLDHPRFDTADLTSIAVCSVGSAPAAHYVIERLQERMPEAMVSNNYGMTEAGSVYCLTPKGESVRRPGSVGRPVPPAEARIVDADGTELAVGEVGEVRLRIPGRPREYFGDPEATADTWVDGWLVTGDIGRVDADGYLYIVGRSKDVIIRGGINIHAVDVEHVIAAHPAILSAAVVGAPHAVLGEDPVAFVVLRPGHAATSDELREFSLGQLADYKVPRRWYFVDDLPRNATGKVVKPELVRRLEESATT
jgi:acyl-CoA synthetase (AMP-forming)/AMP-acid ligase II